MTSLTLQNITKSFGRLTVIDDLSLSVAEGEFVALVGPSGCGKSTLLRIMAGLDGQTHGNVLIGDRNVNALNPKQRNVAMVFQSYALYPHMTVRDNIAFNLELSGNTRPQIAAKVAEAARMLNLTELLDRKPSQLSGGQRQRVAMGRAVVRDPAVFLFDEPLSNLDAQLRVQMRAEIKTLHQKVGKTSIYVTHDQIEAMTLADRIVVLNKGQIMQEGPPMELYNRPRNLFVARFIGSPSMNILPGTVDADGIALAGGWRINRSAGVAVQDGQAVTVGIRPEHLTTEPNALALGGTVRLVEPTGAQTHVTFARDGAEMIAALPGSSRVAVGEQLMVHCGHDALHVFDSATGDRL